MGHRRRQIYAEKAKQKPVEKSLEQQYLDKFGKPPHHRMKPETIAERLKDDAG